MANYLVILTFMLAYMANFDWTKSLTFQAGNAVPCQTDRDHLEIRQMKSDLRYLVFLRRFDL